MKSFPKNFYWGAATASYQVEGWNENTDWAQAARDGKVPSAGRLADHYHRYEEDFDIAKELGHNAHRFSIEWARIEPEAGKWDFAEIEHYRAVLKAMRARNIEPFVTLWHFTLPQWFAKQGGFERADAPQLFARYCAFVTKELGDLCSHFATMNEPNVFATQGWINGEWPPFKVSKKPWQRSYTGKHISQSGTWSSVRNYFHVMNHLAAAHIAAYTKIKAEQPELHVGFVKHVHVYLRPAWPLQYVRAVLSDYYQNHRLTKKIAQYTDEIGVNYYQASKYGYELTTRKTDMGWNFTPGYLYQALQLMARYRKPLFIAEAGLADRTDAHRAEYITEQVHATCRAIADGIDVRGHMYWSLIDNYEWALGTEKCFGLVAVDYQTLERTIRPSAWVYKELIESNGASPHVGESGDASP